MQIWRMKPDGSEQEQVTPDEFNNWFPHISPDGQRMVFLTYEKDVTGHPENKDVMLRMMTWPTRRSPFSPSCSADRAPSMFLPGRPTASAGLCQLSAPTLGRIARPREGKSQIDSIGNDLRGYPAALAAFQSDQSITLHCL